MCVCRSKTTHPKIAFAGRKFAHATCTGTTQFFCSHVNFDTAKIIAPPRLSITLVKTAEESMSSKQTKIKKTKKKKKKNKGDSIACVCQTFWIFVCDFFSFTLSWLHNISRNGRRKHVIQANKKTNKNKEDEEDQDQEEEEEKAGWLDSLCMPNSLDFCLFFFSFTLS